MRTYFSVGSNVLYIFLFLQPFFSVALGLLGQDIPAIIITTTVAFFAIFGALFQFPQLVLKLRPLRAASLFFILFGLIIAARYWSIAPITSAEKQLAFCVIVLVPSALILFATSLGQGSALMHAPAQPRPLFVVGMMSLAFSALFILFASETEAANGRLALPGIENPIWVSRFALAFLVVLVFRYRDSQRTLFLTCTVAAALVIALPTISGTLSRASILGLLLALVYIYGVSFVKLLLVGISVALLTLGVFLLVDPDLIFRGFYSINERLQFLTFVTDNPTALFLGAGLGSFGMAFFGYDIYFYPHNLFLEVWFELGILALVLVVLILHRALLRTPRSEAKALLIFYLTAAMFSGDIIGNTQVFYLSLFILASSHIKPVNASIETMSRHPVASDQTNA